MNQIQNYSNKIPLFYVAINQMIMTIRIVFFIIISSILLFTLLYIIKQIHQCVKKYVDKVSLLENMMIEINKKYHLSCDEFIVYKATNEVLVNELTKTICVLESRIELRYRIAEEENADLKHNTDVQINNIHLRCIKAEEELEAKNTDLDHCVAFNVNRLDLWCRKLEQEDVNSKEYYKIYTTKLEKELKDQALRIELLADENHKTDEIVCVLNEEISSRINDNILIGYKIKNDFITPLFESSSASNIFINIPLFDFVFVKALQYFKNIKEIDIMGVTDKMFIFENIEFTELVTTLNNNNSNSRLTIQNMLDCNKLTKENNPTYFVVCRGLFSYIQGELCLFRESREVQMYVKNGVNKLYNKLKEMNIELKMPNQIYNFVFKC